MKKTTLITLSLLLIFSVGFELSAKQKKAKKNKKPPKNKQETEILIEDDFIDDTEIITREQIDTMFSLAGQLNADVYMATETDEPDVKAELDIIIADEKKNLDKMIPPLRKSSEWTSADEERLKELYNDYKAFIKKYKPSK